MLKKPVVLTLLLGSVLLLGAGGVEAAPKKNAARPTSQEKEFTDPTTGMEFVRVPGGCYQMGDTFGDDGLFDKPVHKVCVSGFYMAKYEVTQEQWQKVMGSNPSEFKGCGSNCPVEQVSWDDAQAYIAKLNAMGSKKYRLPTEAEWEYAARSGGKQEKWAGTSNKSELGEYAWYEENSGKTTHPVGQKRPNSLGLYDMSGNVREWCSDWFSAGYYALLADGVRNPQGPKLGVNRVSRGGSWCEFADWARAAIRFDSGSPGYRDYSLGFRLVSP